MIIYLLLFLYNAVELGDEYQLKQAVQKEIQFIRE